MEYFDRLQITSSHGRMIIDTATGAILERHAQAGDKTFDAIDRFNVMHVSAPYDPQEVASYDILYIGHWLKDGTYESPCTYERPHYPEEWIGKEFPKTMSLFGGDGDKWESHKPRTVTLRKVVTVTAEMSTMLRYRFTVPMDTDDDEIQDLCDALDGGEFQEVENGGDWSQTWDAE